MNCCVDKDFFLFQVMYFSALTTDYLYSIETKYLRTNPSADLMANKFAQDNVKTLGQRGGNANGFAGDSLGNVYMLMPEHNAIYIYKWVCLSNFSILGGLIIHTPAKPPISRCPTSEIRALYGPTAQTLAGMAIFTSTSTSCPTKQIGTMASRDAFTRVSF